MATTVPPRGLTSASFSLSFGSSSVKSRLRG
jgi:hypothetical protein